MRNTICEKIMWLSMKGTITKFTAAEWPDMDAAAFKKQFAANFRQMRNEVDDIGPLTKNPLRICLAAGIIWLAAFDACEGRMDEAMFSRMVTYTMYSPLFKKTFGAKNPFVAEKQRKKVAAFKVANEISNSAFNWNTEYTPGREETEYFSTYHKCGLCALGRKYGHPELIPYLCQMDYISVDMMGGILYRTKTIAGGGDCCDFHVVKKGSKWEVTQDGTD